MSTNNICFCDEIRKSSTIFGLRKCLRLLKQSEDSPALVDQLDMHRTGDQEVACSTPIGSATFFDGD